MIHQPHIMGGLSGQASDIEIHAREMINTKRRLTEIYATHTGRDFDFLSNSMDRDYFMSAEEARDFGLVDNVVKFRKGNKG
jgi:ATP-dependent Clp protease protease subunit